MVDGLTFFQALTPWILVLMFQFMQRSALRETKKESEEALKIDDEHWVLDIPNLKEKE